MDNQANQPPRTRLPGSGAPGYAAPGYDDWRAEQPGQAGYRAQATRARERGLRSSRRTATWSAAALIAGVAVTTGYLAHSMPTTAGGGAATTGTSVPGGKAAVGVHGAPAVGGPVVTSGGSGVAAGAGGGSAGGGGDW
jgi:hypothetical protein